MRMTARQIDAHALHEYLEADGSGVIRHPALLYFSYETQRRVISLSFGAFGTS
jgi:hypothetical protein